MANGAAALLHEPLHTVLACLFACVCNQLPRTVPRLKHATTPIHLPACIPRPAGFRRYDRIRETLLHELAHMVHSEHDAAFKTLNSQVGHAGVGAGLRQCCMSATVPTHQVLALFSSMAFCTNAPPPPPPPPAAVVSCAAAA